MSTKKQSTEQARAMVDEQPAERTAAQPEQEPEAPKAGPRYYNPERNPSGAYLPGVPLGDMTDQEFAALPLWVQRSVDASGFYFRSKPRSSSAEDSTAD